MRHTRTYTPGKPGSIIFFLLAASLLTTSCAGKQAPEARHSESDKAISSDFSLKDVNGNSESLSTYLGDKVVLISFWTSYCEPCQREMEVLSSLYNRYMGSGLVVLSIAIDDSETVAQARMRVQTSEYPFHILFDGAGEQTTALNPRLTTPHTLIIGRNRRIVWDHEGFVPGDAQAMELAVVKALATTVSKNEKAEP